MEEQHLATEETNENMEKDKIIDSGNSISWYKCHFNFSGELLKKKNILDPSACGITFIIHAKRQTI